MWKKSKCNYSCYAQDEYVQNPNENPIDGMPYEYMHDQWMSYNLCAPYVVPRYCANAAEPHVYFNPYFHNYMYAADYGLYGYDCWGDGAAAAPLCEYGYHQLLNPTQSSSCHAVCYSSPSSSPSSVNVHDCEPDPSQTQGSQPIGPVATNYGTITVNLQHNMKVDITIDKAIRLVNGSNGSVAAMDTKGENCCIVHDSGRVLQEGSNVHMEVGQTMAKISKRGLTFTNAENSLVYLVDASGTKSTAEKFRNLKYDVSYDVFFTGSIHGREAVNDCLITMDRLFHRSYRRGDEVWTIAGVRIKQSLWGDVRITRDFGRCVIRASPQSNSMSISTATIHMSVTSENEQSFFVRRSDKRMTADNNGFRVKNGTQKAGFDNKGQLILS